MAEGVGDMICPICGHMVDNDEYWYGDCCLRCVLDRAKKVKSP